jgi:hypothetical protein
MNINKVAVVILVAILLGGCASNGHEEEGGGEYSPGEEAADTLGGTGAERFVAIVSCNKQAFHEAEGNMVVSEDPRGTYYRVDGRRGGKCKKFGDQILIPQPPQQNMMQPQNDQRMYQNQQQR